MTEFESLLIDETEYKTELTAKFKNRKSWVQPDCRRIEAFLPGTVTEVLVKKGDNVKEGQTIILFEAMKMINNVQAPTAGTVKDVYVVAGDKFAKGFLLMEFE